jgi:CubicO group peptidase (beta-lactamase class C family)
MKLLLFVITAFIFCTVNNAFIVPNKQDKMSEISLHDKNNLTDPQKTIDTGLYARTAGDVPGARWLMYTSPAEAGYHNEQLQAVTDLFNKYPDGALMVIHKGKVLLSLGETERRYMLHSMRKVLMNAAYGANLRRIDTNATVSKLGITDIRPLSEKEQSATLVNLLSARSGIYLPSAYMPEGMLANLPTRGSSEPGTNWYYNNWDFNVLNTIFTKQTGLDFFESFHKQIASPLQMEDFSMIDTYYKLEAEKSSHPAYLLKMSARDLARFGMLYLRNGKWGKKQLIPAAWIKASITPRTTNLANFEGRGGFGLLWWISNGINGHPMYYSSGSGGHRLCVFPTLDMVVVHRTNTYQQIRVSDDHINKLLEAIVNSVAGKKIATNLAVTPFVSANNLPSSNPAQEVPEAYLKQYIHPQLGKMNVLIKNGQLVLDTGTGYYPLLHKKDNAYLLGDMQLPVTFLAAAANQKKEGVIEIKFNAKRMMENGVFYF